MSKLKKVVVGSLIAISLGSIGALTAGGFEHRWGGNGEMAEIIAEKMMKHAIRELDLTAAQQANLQALQQKLIALRTEGRMEKQTTRKAIMEQLTQPSLDQDLVLRMVRERLAMAEQRAPDLIAALATFSDSLTAEQKNKVKEKIAKDQGHHKGHHGDHHEGHRKGHHDDMR